MLGYLIVLLACVFFISLAQMTDCPELIPVCISTDSHYRLLWAAVSLIMMLLIYLLICTVNISNQHAVFYIYIASKSLLPPNRTLFSPSVLYLIVTVRPIECRLPLFEQVHWIMRNTRLQKIYKLLLWQLVGRAVHSDWLQFWSVRAPQHLQCQWSVLRRVHCVTVKGCRKMMSLVNEMTP